jgi:hypothetical protein
MSKKNSPPAPAAPAEDLTAEDEVPFEAQAISAVLDEAYRAIHSADALARLVKEAYHLPEHDAHWPLTYSMTLLSEQLERAFTRLSDIEAACTQQIWAEKGWTPPTPEEGRR